MLCDWYRRLLQAKAKKTYDKEDSSIKNLKRILGESTKIRDLTPGAVEGYQRRHLSEDSPRHPEDKVRPATVNREVACLKTLVSHAVRHKKLDKNPFLSVRRLAENNVRMQLLNDQEFEGLVNACPEYLYNGPRKLDSRLRWKSRPC
jgi:site-specific recombinase XerD